jgi:hypothetical protein
MDPIFGTPQRPASPVTRIDGSGRPISVTLRAPERNTVMFTGPPGMGKSFELQKIEDLARARGWPCLRVEASPRESLESRFTRAASRELGGLRSQFGLRAIRKLKKGLTQRRNRQNGAEVRLGIQPVQVIAKQQWDARSTPGLTLEELTTELGKLAATKDKLVVLIADNLDAASGQDSERDLATLTELSKHLEEAGLPVYLVAAGSDLAMARLKAASGGTGITDRYDVRGCGPLSNDELRPTLTEPLRQEGIAHGPEAVDRLLHAAAGHPGRLRDLSEKAVDLIGNQPDGLTLGVAKEAIAQVNEDWRGTYQADWNRCSDPEKELLAKVAGRGARGLSMPAELEAAGDHWMAVDSAREVLAARGLVRETTGDRLTIPDTARRDWVEMRLGHRAATAGVALPGSASPAITSGGGRHAETSNTRSRQVGQTTFTVNR